VVRLLAPLATAVAVGGAAVLVLEARWRTTKRRRREKRTVEGLDISPAQFWLTVFVTASLTFIVVFALTGLVVVSAVPAVVVGALPRAYLARSRAKRIAAVQEAWPDGIRDILASIRSGSSLPAAIENLATLGPPPLRDVFQGFAVYARSLGVVPALEMIRDDLADPTSDRVIEVLILAYERGGAVVTEILSDLATASTKDSWTVSQIRTDTLEHKINSRVVFVLPWLVLVAMTSRSGAFREFYSSPAGVLVVLIGGVMSLVGILVATRLGAVPSEPRVFSGSEK
jgi:tight adherence protein B